MPKKITILVLDDDETWAGSGAFHEVTPAQFEELIEGATPKNLGLENADPAVPASDILDSIRLSMQANGLGIYVETIVADVEDYIVNHF